jgi:lipopolysaccharide transport system ATP-binding protein
VAETVIRAEGLSKRYRIGPRIEYGRLTEALAKAIGNSIRKLRGGSPRRDEHIWALKDITFEVREGEVIGIIGPNGAGKSTLLKLLSRITEPTEGYAEIRGRVGALLEVGTGFHPDLTGRENVYLNGAIIGMARREIDRKFDDIVGFAQVEKFIDTPVKRYSSGMHLRLGFAIAAHLDPEILIVDEVLSVGDANFQRRSIRKMTEVAREGRTVLFVSHNLAAIEALCRRSILLQEGRLTAEGPTQDVMHAYVSSLPDETTEPLADRTDRLGDGQIKLESVHWETSDGQRVPALRTGGDYRFVLTYQCPDGRPKEGVLVTFLVKDATGQPVLLQQTDFYEVRSNSTPPRGEYRCRIPKLPLAAGDYSIDLYVGIGWEPCDSIVHAAQFSVHEGDFFGTGHPGRPDFCKVLVEGEWDLREALG